ncbi:MAG: dephospho-CoA kinase [Bacteroidetes bacterium]|nr:dephospho-CoA kinase [Bacteroidota bacterium]MBS1649579.1 dephospho-CoA kinase [Bacteroidota bacterium]
MLKIGITGGIGSGKSTVSKIFQILGIPVFNADEAAKTIMNEDEVLKEKIIQTFGAATYANGILNRKYLAEIVFNNTFELEKLNALVHPAAIAKGIQWAAQQNAPYIIKEAALMFEAGSAFNLNYVIGVTAPQHIRIQRTMQRDSISREEVLARMNKQIDETIKMKLCDFVIVNDEQQMIIPQVLQLHQQFLAIVNNKQID